MAKFKSAWNAFKQTSFWKKTISGYNKTWNFGKRTAMAGVAPASITLSLGLGLSLGVNAALKNRMRTNLQTTPPRMSPTNYPTDKRMPYNHLGTQGLSLALFNRRHNVLF